MELVATFFKQLGYCLVGIFHCRPDLDSISLHDAMLDLVLTLLNKIMRVQPRYLFRNDCGWDILRLVSDWPVFGRNGGSSLSDSISGVVLISELVTPAAVDVEDLSDGVVVVIPFLPPFLGISGCSRLSVPG